MFRKIAILAVAVFWLLSHDTLSQASTSTHRTNKSSTRSSQRLLSAKKGKVKRVKSRRRRRWNPWRVSSFAESAAEDNSAGEDSAVRELALQALGQWNGSIVVVDPNTGRILSIVNQKLALTSAFTPCSTFKPIVALGALKEGLITPDTQLRVGRRTRMSLTEALAVSNNRFFGKLGEMLGFRRVNHYARLFGFGQKAGRNIPDESPGQFPGNTPKDGVGLLASHGQAMEVTPLQMAAAISAFANGGTLYYLQYPRTPEEVAEFQPTVRRRLEGLDNYFDPIKEGLAAAVVYGTARLAYNPEEQIYGKTGTCSEDGARLGWFVSYANEKQPNYVVVVFLRGGRLMYGPHAAAIAGRLYRDLRLKDQQNTEAHRIIQPLK